MPGRKSLFALLLAEVEHILPAIIQDGQVISGDFIPAGSLKRLKILLLLLVHLFVGASH